MNDEFETKIPAEEKDQVKSQLLMGLRRKYLTHKGDYIMNTSLGKTALADENAKQMRDTITAYNAVEADM